jgi:malate/lactate dehydrogenase
MDRRVPALWPPGPYALASAAVRAIEAVASGSRQFMSGFIVLDGELGARRTAAAFPIMLGPGGVTRIATPSLSGYERTRFDTAVAGS